MNPTRFQHPSTISAIVMLFAFFLPWVTISGLMTLSGYQIPDLARSIGSFGSSFGSSSASAQTAGYSLIYLIPVVSLVVLFVSLTGQKPGTVALVSGVAAAVAIITVIVVFSQVSSASRSLMGAVSVSFGVWLTLLAAFGMGYGAYSAWTQKGSP